MSPNSMAGKERVDDGESRKGDMLLRDPSVVSVSKFLGTTVAFEGFSSAPAYSADGPPLEVSQSCPIPHYRIGSFPQPSGCSADPRHSGELRQRGRSSTGRNGQEREEIPAIIRHAFHSKRGDK